jgi:hypothetical protein
MLIDLAAIAGAGGSRIDLWERIIKATDATTVAEIGVWKGDFAAEILRRCPQITRYFLIDPWAHLDQWNKPFNVDENAFAAIHDEAMRKTAFAADRITVLRGTTREVIGSIPDGTLDLAYIDGDHTLRGITLDLINVLPKVREGGYIGGDDFTKTPWQHDVRFEPTLVCPFAVYFAEAMDLPVFAMPLQQFLLHKDAASTFAFVDLDGGYANLSLNKMPKGWRRVDG